MWTIFGQNAATEELTGKAGQAHAYAISGPDGIGKRMLAKDLFRSRVCSSGERNGGCGQCRQCERVDRGVHADLQMLEMEEKASSIGIDAIKNALQRLSLTGVEGDTVAVVIDDADRMTAEGANSLLKTLEEPPPGALLILLSPRMEKVLPTVRSRCQNIALTPVPTETLTKFLVSGGAEREAATRAAMRAQGRPGTALRQLAKGEEAESLEPDWFDKVYRASIQERMTYAAELDQNFRGNREGVIAVVEEWKGWWRDQLVQSVGMSQYTTGEPTATRLRTTDAVCGAEATDEAVRLLRANGNVRLALERLILKMPKPTKKATTA